MPVTLPSPAGACDPEATPVSEPPEGLCRHPLFTGHCPEGGDYGRGRTRGEAGTAQETVPCDFLRQR